MASGSIAAFSPEATVSITAGTSSNAVALGGSGPSLLVFNTTSSIAFLSLGASTSVIATTGSLPVPAGAQLLLTVGAFPVHRESADREALQRAEEVLRRGEVLVLFPEGTRRAW